MTHTELVNESSKPNVKLLKKIAKGSKIFSIVLIPLYLLQSLYDYFYISTYLAKNIDKVDLFSSLELFTYRSLIPINWLVPLSYLIYPIALYYIYKVIEKPRSKAFNVAFIVWGIGTITVFLVLILNSMVPSVFILMRLLSALSFIALAIMLIILLKKLDNLEYRPMLSLYIITLGLVVLSYLLIPKIAVLATLVINIIFSNKFYQYLNTQPEQKELKG